MAHHRAHVVTNKEQADPYSGSSLVPMLVIGLVLTFAGMIAALAVELSSLRHCERTRSVCARGEAEAIVSTRLLRLRNRSRCRWQ